MIFKEKNQKEGLWVIFLYCVYTFINDKLFLGYLATTTSEKYFLSSFTLIEYLFFTYYINTIINNKGIKKLLFLSSIIFCFFLITYFFTTTWNFFDSVPVGAETILVIILSVYYLFEQINNPKVLFIYNTSAFWIVCGFLICLSGSFFIYIYASYVSQSELSKFWFVTFILSTIKNIFIAIGIFVSKNHNRLDSYSHKTAIY